MTKVVIIGGRGTAVVIAEQIFDANKRFSANVEMLGFALDDESCGSEISGFPIVCKTRELKDKYGKYGDVKFIFSLYRPDLMKDRSELLYSYGINEDKFFTFIHPSVYVARSATIGNGCVLLANVVVNNNAKIGNHNTLNSGCLIGHDSSIGNNNYLAAQCCISSNLEISNGCFIGMNSALRNLISVEDYCIIGQGSNVVKDVKSGSVISGNPAVQVGGLNDIIR